MSTTAAADVIAGSRRRDGPPTHAAAYSRIKVIVAPGLTAIVDVAMMITTQDIFHSGSVQAACRSSVDFLRLCGVAVGGVERHVARAAW
jgi:hypothetical protein